MKRAVVYARISLSKEESVSVDRQLESCRKYAEGRGWQVVGEFVDDGVSATANSPEDRKGWRALLATDAFEAVVIWKIDRLARRVIDFLHVDQALQERGAGLVAVEDPIDMTTPMGRAFATILAVFGEMEAAAISARVTASKEYLISQGRHTGGTPPYGYQAVPIPDGPGWMLAQDPERIDWLAQMVHRALAGETVTRITAWLNEERAPRAATTVRRMADGEVLDDRWHRQSVRMILGNPVMAGMRHRNPGADRAAAPVKVLVDDTGEPVVDPSLAIVTVAQWEQLQEILDTAYARYVGSHSPPPRMTTTPYLSRVALCAHCEVTMMRGTNQRKPVLCCRHCRQTISRTYLDPYLTGRLLDERGHQLVNGRPLRDRWDELGVADHLGRRRLLVSQIDTLHIRRGRRGIAFDSERVLLQWHPTPEAVCPQ